MFNSWCKQLRRYLSGLGVIAGVAALTFLPAGPAQAGFCDVDDTCVISLTNTNVLGVSVQIDVTIDNTGDTTVLTVAWVSDNLLNNPIGIDDFGFNSTSATTVLPAGWSNSGCPLPPGPPPPGCQLDGFGRFASEIANGGSTDLSFQFTLGDLVTTFAENDQGGEFAAHIRFDGGCSAWVSDGTSNSVNPNTACVPLQRAPEPHSLALFGLALLGVFGVLRLRRA